MNAYTNKMNRGKLLVAVLAMFMIVAGAAVVFSDSEVSAGDITDLSQTTVDTWGEKYEATGNITLGGDIDLGEKTLDMGIYTLATNGYNITGGTIKGTTSGSLNSGYMVGLTGGTDGTSTISGTDFVSVATATGGHLPAAAIIVFSNVNATISNCTFTTSGETSYTNFGAVQVNNYFDGNTSTATTFTGCDFGNGIVTYNPGEDKVSNAPVLTFNDCGEIIINFIYDVDLNGKNIVLNNTTIDQTILGWEASTANTEAYGGSVKVTVSGEYDLGTVTKGSLPAGEGEDNPTYSVTEAEGGDLTCIPDGVTVEDNSGIVSVSTYADLVAAIGDQDNNTAVEVNVTGTIDLGGDVYIGSNQIVNFDNATVNGGANNYVIHVEGVVNSDNSYIYAGVDLAKTGDWSASNIHNLGSTGTLTSDARVGYGDTYTLSGSINNGVTMHVYGTLVSDDVTVNGVVQSYIGSTVTVNGTVTVAGQFYMYNADLELSGTITVRNDRDGGALFSLQNDSTVTILEDGTFNVNRSTGNNADPNMLTISDDSAFVVEGTMNITGTLNGAIQDKGAVTFNGTAGTSASIVVYNGVTLNVTSVTGNLKVCDNTDVIADYAGLESFTDSDDAKASVGNTVTLSNVRGVTVSVTVSDAIYTANGSEDRVRVYTSDMAVSGTVSKVTTQPSGTIGITGISNGVTGIKSDETVKGEMTVGDMSVGRNITVTFTGTVDITGTFNANVSDSNDGIVTVNNNADSLTVSGTMILGEGVEERFSTDNLNAVGYKITSTDAGTVITTYYTNFANAIVAIADADDDMIKVYGHVAVSANAEVADGMTVQIQTDGVLTIASDVTLTVADGGVFDVSAGSSSNKAAVVNGVLVITNNGTGLIGTANAIEYDVLKTVGNTDTYSNLAYALANASAGETIVLSKEVTLRTDTVIPEGVTLETGRNNVTLDENVTLTVNGTFTVENGSTVALTGNGNDKADIVVNGVMSKAGTDFELTSLMISGAYFELRGVDYVSNVAYAAQNVDNGTITIMGQVSAGDVTFTERQNGNLDVVVKNFDGATQQNATVLSAGTITLDGSKFTINSGTVDGTIAAAADGATASVDLDRAGAGISLESGMTTDIDGDVDVLYISGAINSGAVEVSAGTVTVKETGTYDLVLNSTSATNAQGSITITSDATLDVPETAVIYVQKNMDDADANVMAVDGTVNLAGELNIRAPATVAGTVNVNDGGDLIVIANTVQGTGSLAVTGTIAVTEAEDETGNFSIEDGAVVTVGVKPTDVGASTDAGAITGEVTIEDASYIKAYPGSDLTGAKINWQPATDRSGAVSTLFNINGEPYMTVYAAANNVVLIQTVLSAETFELVGYDVGLKNTSTLGLYSIDNWYTSAEMLANQKANGNIGTEANANIYAKIEPSYVEGVISEGTGLDLYIDNIRYSIQTFPQGLQVGTHTVSFEVTAGYDGSNASITFNGATVQNGGTITITADMTTFTLVANGAVPSAGQTITVGGDSSDGMGLTDYLLIILVVLIVIMAIMVAMRLMRS